MKIAIEGCAHGELEKIYDTLDYLQQNEKIKIDLLICCGDFQSTRNLDDLQTMAVPKKYQDIGTFYKYYSGEKKAPIFTIFIGGNHEASNYLQELPYGGWVAPNIYYLGLAGVVKINGIRIAGISGIYKGHDYLKGHYEFSPYSAETIRSVYHVRQLEIFRLKQLSNDIDICISHDWPRGVYYYGNYQQLIRFKPHFKDEIDSNRLGSPPYTDLLNHLKPKYWFSAHLHCKFSALVNHENSNQITKFLALDKCLPKRRFLQVIDIETKHSEDNMLFEYDLEWLTILNLTNHLINVKNTKTYMPSQDETERYDFTPTDEEKNIILNKFNQNLVVPENFTCTVEPYNSNVPHKHCEQPKPQLNPQTTKFCDLLGIDDPLNITMLIGGHEFNNSSSVNTTENLNKTLNYLNDSELTLNTSIEMEFPIKRKSINLPEPKMKTTVDEKQLIDFKIDTIGISEFKRKSINLPESKMKTTVDEKHLIDFKIDTIGISEFQSTSSVIEKIEENVITENTSASIFKRRNYDIYKNEDN